MPACGASVMAGGARRRPSRASPTPGRTACPWSGSRRRRSRPSRACGCWTTFRSPRWCPTSTGCRSSTPTSSGARSRRSSTTTWSARRPGSSTPTRRRCSARIQNGKWLTARAVFGFFPANRVGDDDVAIYADEQRTAPAMTLHHLRQQKPRNVADADRLPNACLADFVAPHDSGLRDYLGAFVVTAGLGIEPHVAAFEQALDDYSAILLKALADRLAEACCGVPACRGAPGPLGLCAGREADFWPAGRRKSTGASVPPRATPPARITPRRPPSGSCWTWRRTSASSSRSPS